jgi:hypothetical protein
MTVRLEIEIDFRHDARKTRTPEEQRRVEGQAHWDAVEAAQKAVREHGLVIEHTGHGHRALEEARR